MDRVTRLLALTTATSIAWGCATTSSNDNGSNDGLVVLGGVVSAVVVVATVVTAAATSRTARNTQRILQQLSSSRSIGQRGAPADVSESPQSYQQWLADQAARSEQRATGDARTATDGSGAIDAPAGQDAAVASGWRSLVDAREGDWQAQRMAERCHGLDPAACRDFATARLYGLHGLAADSEVACSLLGELCDLQDPSACQLLSAECP